ncbi:MAG TPA: 50S ribosomal protein L21 [Alphaproteobacteria bacterium]
MYAVIKTGGKQYRVAKGNKITVEKIDAEVGKSVTISDVLATSDGSALKVGADVGKVAVTAKVLEHKRDETKYAFKKNRRHNYRRKVGHRQHHTVLEITAIG